MGVDAILESDDNADEGFGNNYRSDDDNNNNNNNLSFNSSTADALILASAIKYALIMADGGRPEGEHYAIPFSELPAAIFTVQ